MKEIDLFAKTQYWRIFFWLFYPCVLFGIVTFFAIGWIAIPMTLLINTLLPFLIRLLTERIADILVALFSGSRRAASLEEQLAGELTKSRYLKSEKRFDEALQSADIILEQMPEHEDALLLKAQLLSEGFAEYKAARECLRQIMRLELPPDNTVRKWAKEMLTEVNALLQEERKKKLNNE